MASIDLKDAYFQIPIHQASRKFLRFVNEGTVYQFKVLCFGLATAPQVFTRVFGPVSAWAHSRGIRLLRYLDDWLILGSTEEECRQGLQALLALCHDLGIVIHMAKSDLVPKQLAKYLGMSIDSAEARIWLIESRIDKFRDVSAQFLAVPEPSARLWQVVLGPMASLERLVPFGRIRMRSLQFRLREHWSPESDLPTQPVPLEPAVVEDLTWWRDAGNLLRGVPMSSPPPEMLLCTDASKVGWGAHLLDLFVSGV